MILRDSPNSAESGFWTLFLALLPFAGCRPAFEASEEAVERPLLDRDPAENAAELGRWPAWRGHNGSGIARGGSPAIRFSNRRGLPLEGARARAKAIRRPSCGTSTCF